MPRWLSCFALFATLSIAPFHSVVMADTLTYYVKAYVDGRDLLYIQGSTVHWHHLDNAAVGRWNGQNIPTTISSVLNVSVVQNGYNWTPSWPLPPPNEIRFDAYSSVFGGLSPTLPLTGPLTVTLVPIQARSSVSVLQAPTAANNNTLVVDFNDDPINDAAYYEVLIVVQTAGSGGTGQCGGEDVTSEVNIGQGAFVAQPPNFSQYTQNIQIRNRTSQVITGPLYLVFDGLPQTGTFVCPAPNACSVYPSVAVTHCGSPSANGGSVYGPVTAMDLAPGQFFNVNPLFLPAVVPPAGSPYSMFQYTLRVFSGMPQ